MNAEQKAAKNKYMRKYMRKYYKKHIAKIRAQARDRARLLREKTEEITPTSLAPKLESKVFSREKIDTVPFSETCPGCGMMIVCPHCSGFHKEHHQAPRPRPSMVRIKQEDQWDDEEDD